MSQDTTPRQGEGEAPAPAQAQAQTAVATPAEERLATALQRWGDVLDLWEGEDDEALAAIWQEDERGMRVRFSL